MDDFIHVPLVHLVSIQFYGQDNVLIDIQDWNQVIILKDKPNVPSSKDGKLLVIHFPDLLAPDEHASGCWHVQASQHVQKRGFSRTARANNGNKLPLHDVDADAVQRLRDVGFLSIIFSQ